MFWGVCFYREVVCRQYGIAAAAAAAAAAVVVVVVFNCRATLFYNYSPLLPPRNLSVAKIKAVSKLLATIREPRHQVRLHPCPALKPSFGTVAASPFAPQPADAPLYAGHWGGGGWLRFLR